MQSILDSETSIILAILGTFGYVLFADVVRDWAGGFTLEDRVIILSVIAVVLYLGLKFEGGNE